IIKDYGTWSGKLHLNYDKDLFVFFRDHGCLQTSKSPDAWESDFAFRETFARYEKQFRPTLLQIQDQTQHLLEQHALHRKLAAILLMFFLIIHPWMIYEALTRLNDGPNH